MGGKDGMETEVWVRGRGGKEYGVRGGGDDRKSIVL